ncbi:uncharacterized protein KY384_002566 [Bacidia gigantensis]|uniref:uncharacterized protein n=1 Tax=Bacidia gigantensis TaxID=2732470 RepID=UPI001D037C49|nr:uncharacterized protein KY384_002566 [Bacidia gigantensis]KAG8532689.1 hypothetical protein KY384_002566 [Bacidia gigantensis]
MTNMLPVGVYGLKVPAGDVLIPATANLPATFRITMAAIDPSAKPKTIRGAGSDASHRTTLKMAYDMSAPRDDESEASDDEDEYIRALQDGVESDGLSDEDDEDEESSDDEEQNGGPSDPSKSKKARKEAAAQSLLKALKEQDSADESDGDMDVDNLPKVNGVNGKSEAHKGKGKAKAEINDIIGGEDEEDSEDINESTDGMQEVVLCTLDTQKTYQQPIDITIPEGQPTYFSVTGSHAVYLTGNYVVDPDAGNYRDGDSDSEGEYDLSPDEDELELEGEDESDQLDDLEDPRITELDSEDENEAPQLVKQVNTTDKTAKKGKNKRPVEESEEEPKAGASLDDIMAKSLKAEGPKVNGEQKLSKKQLKKLKNNAGKAVETLTEGNEAKNDDETGKGDKKVQFAANLEQAPNSSPSTVKPDVNGNAKAQKKKEGDKQKANLGVKIVQGVKIDDRKLGEGSAAKKGDRLSMRYIGKLSDGKVFDCEQALSICKTLADRLSLANTKGSPFSFKLGANQVIKGWDIGLIGMSIKGERRLVIPAQLAYGSKSQKGIPANSELTFDIKLLSIN